MCSPILHSRDCNSRLALAEVDRLFVCDHIDDLRVEIAYRKLNRHHAECHDNSVTALNAHLSRQARLEEVYELAELSRSLKAGVTARIRIPL